MYGGDVLEQLLGWDEVRQSGQELGHVDKVHAGQHFLVETQHAQRCAEQELLTISTKHIPDTTRQVQRQRLTIQCEDPETEEEKRIMQVLSYSKTST